MPATKFEFPGWIRFAKCGFSVTDLKIGTKLEELEGLVTKEDLIHISLQANGLPERTYDCSCDEGFSEWRVYQLICRSMQEYADEFDIPEFLAGHTVEGFEIDCYQNVTPHLGS